MVINFVWCFGVGYLVLCLIDSVFLLCIDVVGEEMGFNEVEYGMLLGIGYVEDVLD